MQKPADSCCDDNWAQVYIGLGSNLGDSEQVLQRACWAIAQWPSVRNLRMSNWYRSRPQGPQDQPDYVNGACCFTTHLAPRTLLAALQQLEMDLGKIKQRHWGERLVDLDVICYGQLILNTPELTLPHPMASQRDFVLVPLQDLAPDLVLPKFGSIQQCLEQLPETFLYAVADTSLCHQPDKRIELLHEKNAEAVI
ncbi:2-amino-4-hydroxy-6-hydroxymethyldihydropteridine diphosphokinase [Thiomicrospira sp. ALE5]|uniref:2-amino-4-hydroxy-6- hydroxymethyldihydropteridine diphosphokinase n=1 Tax=Thiomicrospira sp. ALE5 TaxID=748650 RepID=UPI001F1A1FDC|nr:2-amino-4-hydroxy-6-hydroxymethyldihydropteridine diphosphokinase [Thiomicrospira sp. ALE5]